ncbi:patatin-like phospholipase family protein [Pasteuria penetrans]|uniref:patatin-like phospholipase family protein n=1 Tax=Pasteuria penetrans TaxID=86005 RepID=UPI000FB46ED1|nr:patatin-like phospholipase family protein [Pasteuria penetrans]
MKADAIFEGGGIKVVGLVGAFSVAEKRGYRFHSLAGTSAGALLASLLAAGYTADELRDIVMGKDFSTFLASSWYDRIPYVGSHTFRFIRMCCRKGFYSGNRFEKWLQDLLAAKKIYTFSDLPPDISLSIVASDITRGRLLLLPEGVKEYGGFPEKMSVARAVRMSCSIPFLFDPVRLTHYPTSTTSYVVDGGILSNFPVWIFDRNPPRWPTFGFRFVSGQRRSVQVVRGPLALLRSVVYTMINAHDDRCVDEQELLRTIEVPSMDIKVTDFSLSPSRKHDLYQAGVEAAENFFKNWSFVNYITVMRRRTSLRGCIRGKNYQGVMKKWI